MKLEKIIAIADKVYPDGLVKQAYKEQQMKKDASVGDGLAEFIARELADTYDSKASSLDQIQEAHRVMSRARTELGDVAMAFSDWTPLPKRRRKK